MGGFTQIDLALLAAAGFVAVVSLVGLMRSRRDQLLATIRDDVQREQEKKRREERKQKQAAAKAARKAS